MQLEDETVTLSMATRSELSFRGLLLEEDEEVTVATMGVETMVVVDPVVGVAIDQKVIS